MSKEVLEKIGICLIIAAVCFLVMWYGAASGDGDARCFAGVAC